MIYKPKIPGEEAKDRVEKARTRLAAVVQGMTTDDDGNAITIEAQINSGCLNL